MNIFKRISTIIVLSSCLLLCTSCGGGGDGGDGSGDTDADQSDNSSSSSNTSYDATPYTYEFDGNWNGGGRYQLTPTSAYAGTVSATIYASGDEGFIYTGQRTGQGTYVWTTKPSDSSSYAVLEFTLYLDDCKVVAQNVEYTIKGGYFSETLYISFTNQNKTSAIITEVLASTVNSKLPVNCYCSFSSTPH